jgi:hypothetical protein
MMWEFNQHWSSVSTPASTGVYTLLVELVRPYRGWIHMLYK